MHLIVPIVLIPILLAIGCAGLFLILASRLNRQEVSAEWLDTFSLESYAPMERLLGKKDVDFLASQAGYSMEIAKRLMAERRKIFASYLGHLVRDFNQLMAIGKLMVVFAPQDREEFARRLFRQQVRFYAGVCSVRLQLALSPLGCTVDAERLVGALAAMRDQVQSLATPRVAYFEIG